MNSIQFDDKKEQLKSIFNMSSKYNRKNLPDINNLNKLGMMETGGNYLIDNKGRNLHDNHYTKLSGIVKFMSNFHWRRVRKVTRKIYISI